MLHKIKNADNNALLKWAKRVFNCQNIEIEEVLDDNWFIYATQEVDKYLKLIFLMV